MTDRQGAFCREYLVDHCATQAAIRAGFSRRTAQEQGSRLLSNVMVRREIDRLMAERSVRLGIDADAVVRRFDNLYYEALVAGDLSTAARCLEALAKCVGAYEEHNRQKVKTPEDMAALKARLEAMGMDFSRKNFPPHLVGVRPGRRVPELLPQDAATDDTADTAPQETYPRR